MHNSIIKLENVTKKYGDIFVLKNINFALLDKECVAIIGPSGAGKSTLLRCICQLEEISTGTIFVRGKQINNNKRDLSTKIGVVFQQFNLFSHFTVLRNLTYAPQLMQGGTQQDILMKADKLLASFGLTSKKDVMPSELSGGQKQRVAICRALMMNPEIMLFDEPSSALDPESIIDLVSIIKELKKQMTIIIITHNLRLARAITDKILFIDKGQVLACQPTAEFFISPNSHRARIFLENLQEFC